MVYDKEKGTYAFENAFRLKKARLNMDETLALAMARKMLGTLGETFERALESLERKVLDVSFPCRELLPSSALVLPCGDKGEKTDVSKLLMALTKSCVDHSFVWISYQSLYSGEETRRDVEPSYLFFSPDCFWNLRLRILRRRSNFPFNVCSTRPHKAFSERDLCQTGTDILMSERCTKISLSVHRKENNRIRCVVPTAEIQRAKRGACEGPLQEIQRASWFRAFRRKMGQ